jgi:hypothetical protein
MPFHEPPDCSLAGVAYHLAMDSARSLVLAADRDRIKSYDYRPEQNGRSVHTLASGGYRGALAVLSGGGGRVVRAGNGKAAVWELDSLPTHGESGYDPIGDEYQPWESMREEDDDVDDSGGSEPTTMIAFSEKTFAPYVWAECIGTPGVMLSAAADPRGLSGEVGDYRCVAIDLERGGTVAARYLGHGGTVNRIRTSPGDPNCFTTSCSDGFARLYDVRRPLPVLTVDVGQRASFCGDAIMAHPNGIPSEF